MKKFYSLLLAMLLSISASAVDFTGGTKFYLTPENWNVDGAWYSLYVYGSAGDGWATFADDDADGVYEAEAPEGTWTNLIAVRNDPAKTTPSWDAKWNQTNDLTYDGTNNMITITGWNPDNYTWSTYSDPEEGGDEPVEVNATTNTGIYQDPNFGNVWYQLWVYGLSDVEVSNVSATVVAKDGEGNVAEEKTVENISVDGDGNIYTPIGFTTLARGTTYTFSCTVTISLAAGEDIELTPDDKEYTTQAEDPNALKATLDYSVSATETEATLSYKITVAGNTAEPTAYKVWLDAPGNEEMASAETAEGTLTVDVSGGAVTYWLKGQVTVDDQTINTDPNDVAVTFSPKAPAPEVENANVAAGEEGWSQLGTPMGESEAWAPAIYQETTIDDAGILSFSVTIPSVPEGFVANAYISSVEGEQGSKFYDLSLAATPAAVTNGIVTYTGTSGEDAYTELPVYVTYRFAYAGGESKVKQISVGESSEPTGPVYEYCFAGSVNSWSLEANRVKAVDGVATWTFDKFSGDFKIIKNVEGESKWDVAWGADGDAKIEVGTAYTAVSGGGNIVVANDAVEYTGVTVTFTEATGEILITATGEVALDATYEFVGEAVSWNFGETYFTQVEDGVYMLTLDKLYGSFKVIKNGQWAGSYITDEKFVVNTDYVLSNINADGRNIYLNDDEEWTEVTLTLTIAADGTHTLKGTAGTVSGLDTIEVDSTEAVEYYNLQGVKVANPENGLYIKKQGNKVSKVLVK